MLLASPSSISAPPSIGRMRPSPIKSMAVDRSSSRRNDFSPLEARISLVIALASHTSSLSQKLVMELAGETAKYVFPKRIFESRNLEEALMSVPDLETVKFKVLKRSDQYEIREVEPYFVAEVTMPGKYGFDFNGASQSFNTLAEYLFGKNTKKESMVMTTPVITRRTQSDGERMEMTTPVITKRYTPGLDPPKCIAFGESDTHPSIILKSPSNIDVVELLWAEDQDKWRMSFVMPSKYGSDLPLPKDSSVTIKEVPGKTVAVVAFSGFVNDEEVKARESKLRVALKGDPEFQVKDGALIEVAQYNPPFTLPFTRRNEISLKVERKQE